MIPASSSRVVSRSASRLRLVVGEGVHRVEDERLHPGHAVAAGAEDVVEDRVQERLGLAGPGAGGDERGQRARLVRTEVRAAEPGERLGLVAVGREADVPAEDRLPAVGRGPERQAEAEERALEDAVLAVAEELGEREPGIRVGEREGRGQVVEQAVPDLARLGGRE